jgi:hypothetical protein
MGSSNSRMSARGFRQMWEPPRIISLPVSATANTNKPAYDGGLNSFFHHPNPDPPLPPPRPRPSDRLPLISDAFHSIAPNNGVGIVPKSNNRAWAAPAFTALPVNATASMTSFGGDGPVRNWGLRPDPRPQPRPPRPPHLVDRMRSTLDAAATSESYQKTWVPPALSALPISATALGNAYKMDGVSFAYGVRSNPEPQPRPPRPVDRLPVMSDASQSGSPDKEAVVCSGRTWVPPAVAALLFSATANTFGPGGDAIAPNYRSRPQPQHRAPGAASGGRLSGDRPAPLPSKVDLRSWVPPAVTLLPVSATAVGMSGTSGDGPWWTYSLRRSPKPQPRPPRSVDLLSIDPGATPSHLFESREGNLSAFDRPDAEAPTSEVKLRTWAAPRIAALPIRCSHQRVGRFV